METTDNEWKLLLSIEHIVYSLNKENISQSAYLIFNNFDKFYPLSFNTVIYQMVNTLFTTKINNFDVYLEFLKEIETIEENNKCKPKNFINPQTPSYLLAKMIEQNLLDINNIQKKRNPYLIHYMTEKEIRTLMNLSIFQVIDELLDLFIFQIEENYEELSKNDWELHKQLIKEGVNPNEIAKIIRNDEIEKLQEISSQSNFDFNQTIEPSLYERCTFVNQEDVTIIDYAAFFSAVKCFKYLLINGAKVENTGKYAIAGGNEEIIHLCEQNHSTFCGAYETAIAFHRNDIFLYIYENKIIKKINLNVLGKKCILYHNYEILSFLLKKGMKINNDIINESAFIGNIFLTKYFLDKNLIPKDILVYASASGNFELVKYVLERKEIDINSKNKNGNTALMIASENGNLEIVKLLLEQEGIDINAKSCKTALIYASEEGHTEIVKLLLEQKGINVNVKDNYGYGYTALIWASRNGYVKTVKLFLEQEGIDINAKSDHGMTALILASQFGHIKIVKLLLQQRGIDINAKDCFGTTALMKASSKRHIEIVKLLLQQRGIDINAKDCNGDTAFSRASSSGYTEIFELLK